MGNLSSGKSALVHRYLTGTYVQEESPEGELCFQGVWGGLGTLLSIKGDSASAPVPWSSAGFPCCPPAPDPALLSSQGGRFKKEIVVDGQSYLLLIRDEGGPPELQVGD